MWRDGKPVLSGAFGVAKANDDPIILDDGSSGDVLRFIVNAIPPNALQRIIAGDVGALPTSSQWEGWYSCESSSSW